MSDDEHPVWRTLQPVAAAVGGELLPPGERTPGDISLEFEGETVGVLRLGGLDGALGRLIESVERELGDSLPNLSRTGKQAAVRLLYERGAFLLRKGVEDVATAHPGILEAAAIGIPHAQSGEAVRLFVVKRDPELTADDIIAHCRENLTGYKIPREVVFRDELPKTNVGKILRRELRD